MPCYATLCQHTVTPVFSFLSAPKSAILTSLFCVGFISAVALHLAYIFPALFHDACWHQPLLIFFQRIVSLFQRCYSTTFSMSLFKDFVQRWFPFFKSSLLFPKTFCFQVPCSMFGFRDFFPKLFFQIFFR